VERLILDSGAVIALERADPSVQALPDDADVAVAAITASELLVSVELADAARRSRRKELVEGVLDRVEVIAFDIEIARHHAVLMIHARGHGRPRGAHDLQIAATARATGRIVITTDTIALVELPDVNYRLVK
jgi:tRNA(fMet)-specific endonuclease VapC